MRGAAACPPSAFSISLDRLLSQANQGLGQELFMAFMSFMKKEQAISLLTAITTLRVCNPTSYIR